MKITKDFEKLARNANGDYVLDGDLICEDSLEVELDDRLVVRGRVEAKKAIRVDHTLIAGEGIEAGWGIEAKTFISSKKRIFAGLSLYRTSKDCNKKIECAELREGEICYGDLIITKAEESK